MPPPVSIRRFATAPAHRARRRVRALRACAVLLAATAATALPFLISCTAPGAPKGKILIEFWDFPRLPAVQEFVAEAIDEFMRRHPEVHIEYTRLSWSKGSERMDISAFAGRPPDVAGAVLNLKYVESGLLIPVDDYLDEPIPENLLPPTNPPPDAATASAPSPPPPPLSPPTTWREDIHPSILRDVQWDGRTWSFPWYKEAFVLMLNKDHFEERGVPLPRDGRWDWDEFLDALRALTFDRDGDGKIDVYGIGYSTGRQKWEVYPFLFGDGMEILSPDLRTARIDSEATRRGVARLIALEHDEKVALPGAGGMTDETTWPAFSGPERRLAMVSQGLWAINSARVQNQRNEQFRRERPGEKNLPPPLRFEVALFPRMPGAEQVMTSYGVGSLMVFNRPHDPERTRWAARFARYLTLETGQRINREAGLFPSRVSTGNLFEDDPHYRAIWPYIAEAVSPPILPVWHQLDQVVNDALQLALMKRLPLDEAVARMQSHMTMILDDFWKSHDAARETKR